MVHVHTQRGTSLIETIIAVGLVSLLVLVATTFVQFVFHAEGRLSLTSEVSWQAQQALMALRERVVAADSVVAPTAGNADTTLTLQTTSGTYDITDDNGVLSAVDGGTVVSLHRDLVTVSSVAFTNLSTTQTTVVRVSFTMTATNGRDTVQQTFYTTITSP